MRIDSKSFSVITGAASGFGRALAVELAARGSGLLLSDIALPGLEETARLCRERGARRVLTARCDVARAEDLTALVSACEGETVSLVVNNAGVGCGGTFEGLSLDDWKWTLDIDLNGVIHGCHAFLPLLRRQRSGHFLNVASAAGLMNLPRMGPYNVAKAGVIALSETLHGELLDSGVGVTVLCPTFFKTHILDASRFGDGASRDLAQMMMDRGIPAETVVRRALAAVERGRLYCVPMADGRILWRLKRLAPDLFMGLMARIARWFGR
jgi:short-subunit dehydrogenase